LITSQAAYFYYQPADPLQSSIQLGNGLAKAIEGVASHNGLAREIVERVDGRIAQLGLQQAIEVLASYYNTVPNGRSSTDEISRSLKTRVRAYANELRQVSDFTTGLR